jgi:hypothetical protein
MQLGETMKFQAPLALSSCVYLAAFVGPAAFAASGPGGAAAQAERSTRSPMLTVVTGVSGGQTIKSSPLALLKVNGIEGTGLGNAVGSMRNTATQPLQEVAPAAANAEPGTLAMLLTGLGVMGSIARRRRLAKKAG